MEETWGWRSLKRWFEDQGWFYRYEGEKGGTMREIKGLKGKLLRERRTVREWKYTDWGLREGRSERWLIAGVEWCSSEVEALHSRTLVPKGDERRPQHWKLTRSHKVSVCALNACSGNRYCRFLWGVSAERIFKQMKWTRKTDTLPPCFASAKVAEKRPRARRSCTETTGRLVASRAWKSAPPSPPWSAYL